MLYLRQEKIVNHTINNMLHTALLLSGMALITAILGYLFAGVEGIIWAIAFGGIMLWLSPGISPQFILRMHKARLLQFHQAPELYNIVQELARRAGLGKAPNLYYIPSNIMNAFAIGQRNNAAIAVTDALLKRLNMRELTGVLAHEMSHIRNNDIRVMGIANMIGRMTGMLAMLGQILLLFNLPLMLLGQSTISWLVILILIAAPTLSNLLQLALSRTREFNADLGAVTLTGDPEGLAAALEKLDYYQAGFFRRFFFPAKRMPSSALLRTHPPTKERVQRLLSLRSKQAPLARPGNLREDLMRVRSLPGIRRNPRWFMLGFST